MKSREADLVLAKIASRQFGVLSLAQARSAGLSYDVVRHRVRVGALVPVDRGVFRLPGNPVTWEQRAMSALLVVGSDCVLYGRSAATVWKLDLPEPGQVEVVSGDAHWRAPSAAVVLHRSRDLPPGDRTRVGSFPVTTLARTLVDVAVGLDFEALVRVVDEALSRRVARPDQLDEVAARLATPGRTGPAAVRRIVAPWLRGREFDSVAEAACLRQMARAGLPEPVTQYEVNDTYRVDFAWPRAMLLLEVDSFRWHANARSHADDLRRANQLAAWGWTVIRAAPTELAESPEAVLCALRRHLLPVGV
jgi:very-short-patch-repair endonuclease